MGPIDYVLIGVLLLVVGIAVFYVVRSKKKGVRCIGCPDSKSCSGCQCGCEKGPNKGQNEDAD